MRRCRLAASTNQAAFVASAFEPDCWSVITCLPRPKDVRREGIMKDEGEDSSQRWELLQPAGRTCSAWDAGDIGCGELVLALRTRLLALPPGGVIRVRATDPAAPEDLPAWCRLTGNSLVSADHPTYLIRRKGE